LKKKKTLVAVASPELYPSTRVVKAYNEVVGANHSLA